METIGRNEPCYCGSGLKYKRCCLGKDQANDRLQNVLLTSGNNSVSLAEDDIIHMIDTELNWRTDSYRELAYHLLERMRDRYEDNIILEAIVLWHRFSEDTKPSFRKPGIHAAAIEYAVCEANGLTRSQSELAEIYEISTASLSKRFLEISEYSKTKLSSKASAPSANAAVSAASSQPAAFNADRELERLQRAMRGLALNR